MDLERKIKSRLKAEWHLYNDCETKEDKRRVMGQERNYRIKKQKSWIEANHNRFMNNIIDGDELRVSQISPYIVPCRNIDQKNMAKYVRLLSSYPYRRHVGRDFKFLIRDRGHPAHPIMGVFALGSPIRQINVRDCWVGWKGSQYKKLREYKLQNIANLHIAIGVMPYSVLLSGKLICYAAISNEIRRCFVKKYVKLNNSLNPQNDHLALICATSLYGTRSSQYNRLSYNGKKIFQPIGETKGYGTIHISDTLFALMIEYLSRKGYDISSSIDRGANWRLRMVRYCIRELGLSEDKFLLHGHRRGLYVAPLGYNFREFLLGKSRNLEPYDFPLEQMIVYWKQRWLKMRLKNSDIIERVKLWSKKSYSLLKDLNTRE